MAHASHARQTRIELMLRTTALLAVSGLCSSAAVAQSTLPNPTARPDPRIRQQAIQPAPNRFVTGRIRPVDCDQPLSDFTVEIKEYFYVRNGETFEIPTSRAQRGSGMTYDRLQDGTSVLEQGRTLARAVVGADGSFRAGWYTPVIRVGSTVLPWIDSVRRTNARGTTTVTVYTMHRARLVIGSPPPPPHALWMTSFVSEPLVTFFGAEDSKDVGTLAAVCHGFNF